MRSIAIIVLTAMVGCSSPAKTVIQPAENRVERNEERKGETQLRQKVLELEIVPPGQQPSLEQQPTIEPVLPSKDKSGKHAGFHILEANWTPLADPEPPQTPKSDGITVTMPDGTKTTAPAGSRVKFKYTDTDDGKGPSSKLDGKAISKSPGISTSSDEVAAKYEEKVAAVDVPGLDPNERRGGVGRGAGSKITATLTSGEGFNVFYVLGALVILASAGAGYFLKSIQIAVAGVACGLTLIAVGVMIDKYPWMLLVGLGVVAVTLGVWVWEAKHGGDAKIAFSVVRRVIDQQDTGAASPGDVIKSGIGNVVGSGTKLRKIIDKQVAKDA